MVVTTPHLVVCFFVGFKSLGDFVRLFFYFFCRCGGAHNHEQPYFLIFFGSTLRPLDKGGNTTRDSPACLKEL